MQECCGNPEFPRKRLSGLFSVAGMRRIVFFTLVALVIIVLDQVTKLWIVSSIPVNRAVEVIPGFFDLVHARNPGAAFGIFSRSAAGYRSAFFIAISAVALVVILWLLITTREPDVYLLAGYTLFFGGAAGNLIDRVLYGEVIDFLDFYVGAVHWPAFNVADSALCLGTACFFLHVFLKAPEESPETDR